MATPKKKHLIELMIEAGVKWPDGAEYAAQDKSDKILHFYRLGKPNYWSGDCQWMADNCSHMSSNKIALAEICRNWHQTIVTREQYALADAESWDACMDTSHLEAKSNQVCESEDIPPSQPVPEYCASVMRQMPDNTIEQLTADYRTKTAEAQRQQTIADEARKTADDALLALEKAGELLGLVISIDTKSKHVEQPAELMQPIITDWRDLRIGDVVEYVDYDADKEGVIIEIDSSDEDQPIKVVRGCDRSTTWPWSWRFIRRP